MSDVPFPTNLLPSYQTPQAMIQAAANTASTQAGTQQTVAQTGLIGAQTGLLGVQTQGADIANQGAALSLSALQKAYAGGVPSVGQTSTAIGDTGVGSDDVTQHAIDKFAPLPTKPPAALQQQAYLLSLGGKSDAAKGLLDMYQTQVAGANQQRQLAANQSYQTAETVASSPPGTAFETLSRVNPQAAAGLKQKYADATPDELDQDVRTFAQHIGIATHQYTGRDTDFQNGVLVDKKDGKPVLGSTQVLTGLDAGGKASAFASANEQVQIGDQLPQPKWQASGFPSAEAYVIAADKNARSSASNPPAAPGNTSATAPSPKPLPTAASVAPVDPVLKAALNDHEYDLEPLPTPKTQEDLKSNNDLRAASNAARTELLSDAKDATNSGAQALQYMKAAQAIMDSKGAPVTGALGGLVAKLTGPFGSVDATNYQEAAKYLGNAAIQAGKGNFGKGMTQNDVSLQKDELSPSVHMTDAALKDLIGAGIKNTQYTLDSGKRVGQYLASGKDPQRFAEWNDTHFNRSATVNGPAPAASAPAGIPTAGVIRGGYKFLGGDPSVKANWSKQ